MSSANGMVTLLGQLCLNSRRHSQDKRTKGYALDGIKHRGALHLLKRVFYGSNFREFGARRRAKYGSSKELGDAVHRHVFHRYKCAHIVCKCPKDSKRKCRCKPTCVCKERFGTRTRKLKKNAVYIDEMLQSFSKFLDETGLFVYDCETIVGCPEMRIATSIDVLCVDSLTKPKRVYVIELKTGYAVGLKSVRTMKGTGTKMSGDAGQHIDNSIYNHHQLQLWFGMEALQKTHGIEAAGGYVVYVNKGRRLKYYPAEAWWFRNTSMRTRIYQQLRDADRLRTPKARA